MDIGYIKAQLGPFTADQKKALANIFTHICQSVDLGEPTHQMRAGNLQAYYLASTTAASTGEFSVAHGLDFVPNFAIPVIDLRQRGVQTVSLEVSRPADGRRIYLKSPTPNAAVVLLAG